jgi:hypothetical protein
MELVEATGKSVAREGDPVQMSGGTNGDGVFVACGGSVVKVQPQG